MDYKKANTVAKELARGALVIGTLCVLGAMYMIWFGGIYD